MRQADLFLQQGMAMLSAILITAMLSVLVVSFLHFPEQTQTDSARQHLEDRLAQQTLELAAFSAMQLRLGNGIPEGLHHTAPGDELSGLVTDCQNRLDKIAPRRFTADRLSSGAYAYHPVTSRKDETMQTSFFKSVETGHGSAGFLIITCSFDAASQGQSGIAVLAAEHVLTDGSWYVVQQFSM